MLTVLLCRELPGLGGGIDLAAVEAWLGAEAPGVRVQRPAAPCLRPERWLDEGLRGASGLVLAVCAGGGARDALDARARRLGLDPTAIAVLPLGAYCAGAHPGDRATEQAKLLLHASLARVRAHAGSGPEHTKPLLAWHRQVSRRSLFTLPPLRYEVVPSIREASCAAGRGCRVCIDRCPREALHPSDGRVVLDRPRCTGCGACVALCPRGAFDFPGASLASIEAEVTALLDMPSPALDPRGILFVCEKSAATLQGLAKAGYTYPAGWLPVTVPCLGMVTPVWLLESLNRSAAAVGLLPCPPEQCRLGRPAPLSGRVEYCRQLLRLVGGNPDRVRLLDPATPGELARSLALLSEREAGPGHPRSPARFAPGEAAAAVLALAARHGASPSGRLTHAHSPLGLVDVEAGCTACAACARACPTGALTLAEEAGNLSLSFEPRRCIGCGACAPVCPERVVRLERATDLRRLSEGTRVLHRDREVGCERCGAPIAPRALLERVAARLGETPVIAAMTSYCPACRGALV